MYFVDLCIHHKDKVGMKRKERMKQEEEFELDIWEGRWGLSSGLVAQDRTFRNTVGSPILWCQPWAQFSLVTAVEPC